MHSLASINIVDLLLDAVCIVDPEGRYLYVSQAYERIFGYDPQEVLGRRMIELVHPDDRERTLAAARNIMAGHLQLHFENRYIRKDGQVAHIRWTARWLPEQQVRLAVAHDITERKHTESLQAALYAISEAAQAAEDLESLFARIHQIIGGFVSAENFCVALHDPHNDRLEFPYHVDKRDAPRPAPIALSGSGPYEEVVRHGRTLLCTQNAEDGAPGDWLGVPLQTQGGVLGALVLRSHGLPSQYTERDKELLQYVCTQVASAVERRQMRERLERLAQYDQLTQLPNRQLFLDRLRAALARARREQTLLSLLFIDLDRFKEVNDTLGHATGDQLLQGVAQRLRGCVRASDTVARLGGDEFVVLVENGRTRDHATTVASKILDAFALPFDLQERSLHMRPSIGVALYPEHGQEEHHLLSHADAAMYQSKKNGGNRVMTASTGS
ncbi:GGDEF domain-containing protein [Paenacidovorax monticola]|uniref:Diguanylate cyclase n=1 Tax=Paenacidovorax monticola TaxID=1926868 RepID=A0A7H0HHW1_9BURK|nr:GGDEF domain-containing protein [Paenacidovorax monticola]QNP60127.1 diguanylate cyclase [Paenacidovorax monticola]